MIDQLDCPVIVSGGICDGRGPAAVLAMGGAAVAMGTRFIASQDRGEGTRLTHRPPSVYTGRSDVQLLDVRVALRAW